MWLGDACLGPQQREILLDRRWKILQGQQAGPERQLVQGAIVLFESAHTARYRCTYRHFCDTSRTALLYSCVHTCLKLSPILAEPCGRHPNIKADGTACHDGDGQTTNDVCFAGTCRGCPMTTDDCEVSGSRDPSTGQCLPARTKSNVYTVRV